MSLHHDGKTSPRAFRGVTWSMLDVDWLSMVIRPTVFTGLMTQPTLSKHWGGWLVIQTGLNLTMLTSPCYNTTLYTEYGYAQITMNKHTQSLHTSQYWLMLYRHMNHSNSSADQDHQTLLSTALMKGFIYQQHSSTGFTVSISDPTVISHESCE